MSGTLSCESIHLRKPILWYLSNYGVSESKLVQLNLQAMQDLEVNEGTERYEKNGQASGLSDHAVI